MRNYGFVLDDGRVVRKSVLDDYIVRGGKSLEVDSFKSLYGKGGVVEPLYDPDALLTLLEYSTIHNRCVKTKARDTVTNWTLNPLSDGATEENKLKLKVLFDDPSFIKSFTRAMVDYESIGYGVVEVLRDDEDNVVGFEYIPAFTMRRTNDKFKAVQVIGNKMRYFRIIGNTDKEYHYETGEVYNKGELSNEKKANDIIWLNNFTPKSALYGMPDIIPAIPAIIGDLNAAHYNISFFENYGVPSYAIFITGDFDEGEVGSDGLTDFERSLQEHFKTLIKNPHANLILPIKTSGSESKVEVKFEKLNVDVKDSSFQVYREKNRDEILTAHGVPPYRIGIAETGSLGGNFAIEATKIYNQSVIRPKQEELEIILNYYIIKRELGIEDWEIKFRGVDIRDIEREVDVAVKLFEHGALTPNQLIKYFGDIFGVESSDHPALDEYYINGNPITMDSQPLDDVEDALKDLAGRVMDIARK